MDRRDSLEYKILQRVVLSTSIMSLFATAGNLLVGLVSTSIVTTIATIFYLLVYFNLKNNKNFTISNFFVVLSFFVYCIFLWFYNSGSLGGTAMLIFVLYFISSFIIQIKNQNLFFIFSIIVFTLLFFIEFTFPNSIQQTYNNRNDRFLDITIGSVLAMIMIKLLVSIVKKSYNEERRLVQQQNVELELGRKELQESKDFFNKLAENTPGVSYQFGLLHNGKIFINYISSNVENIYEVTVNQVYEDNFLLYRMITNDTAKQLKRDILLSATQLNNIKNEHKIVTPSGKTKHIMVLAKPQKQPDGSVIWYGYNNDITDRKLEEENLLASESKFRFISENTSDGIVVLEKEGITYASKSYQKMFGYTEEEQFNRSEEEILNLIHPDDRLEVLNSVDNAVKNKQQNLVIEYRYLHKNGNYIWREDTINFLYDSNGKNTKDVLVVRNVTEQKKNRIELEQITSMLEQTSSLAKVGGWEVNMNTHEVLWTDLIYEIYELSKTEFAPNVYSILRYFKKGGSRNKITEFFKQAVINGKFYDEELELITANGNHKWVRAIGKPLFQNGKCVKVFGTLQDITQKKQTDLKLKELALVASKTTDAVIITDANAKISWVNNAFEKMTEYTLEEVVGKEQKDLLAGAKTNFDSLNKMMEATKLFEPTKATLLNYTKSGKPIWFDISITPVFDENGVCTNFIDVKKDVTERMEKQEQLQALTNVTADQNKRLLNFTYIVSHNIRSHSANLTGLINLIDQTEDEEEKQDLFNMLKTSTHKLEETIQNLNEIISVQNNLNQAKSVLNLKQEIERTFLVVNDVILESKVQIKNEVADNINLEVIPAYLDSILLNLITNAIKYRSPERQPVIELSTETEGEYLVLLVKDNGLGLDLQKFKDKLFGMYKTFHNNPNSRGIGLFITKNQIEAMNGKVEVESQVNVGTTFKIYFPQIKQNNIVLQVNK
jgi:PAS domain S-box-containing protein